MPRPNSDCPDFYAPSGHQPNAARYAVVPLFAENVDFASTLVLVNDANRNTYADVTVRGTDGTVAAQQRVNFASHSQRRIVIGELLRAVGSSVTSGSIVIEQSPDLRGPTVVAQLELTYRAAPDSTFVDEEVYMPMSAGSHVLRGVVDDAYRSPILAVTSLSDQAQSLTINCLPEHGKPFSTTLNLLPNHTAVAPACEPSPSGAVDFQDILSQLPVRELGATGESIISTAGSDSFAAFALTPHEHGGQTFFTGMVFNDPHFSRSSTDVYAGVPVGRASLLPEGRYTPSVALSNFGAKPANVSVRFSQTSSSGEVDVENEKQITILPGQSESISFDGLSGSPDLQNSFEVASDASPGDVMSKLVSRGNGSLRVVEMATKDLKDEHDGGLHPFSLEQGTDSNLLLFNSSESKQVFNVLIGSEGVLWQKAFTLMPMETRNISLRALISERVQDDTGRHLPQNLPSGEIGWFVSHPAVGKGRLLQSNREVSMARSFSCPILIVICGMEIGVDDPLLLDFVTSGAGSLNPVWCESFSGSCPGEPQGQTGSGQSYSWTSSKTTVASISGSSTSSTVSLFGAGVGATTMTGKITDGNGCSASGSGPTNVTPPIDHLDVVVDNLGFPSACPTTGIYVRQMKMQAADSSDKSVTDNVSVKEAFSNPTTNSCGNGQPVPSSCGATSSGQFIDTMAVSGNFCNSGIKQSSGCGFSLTSTWSACGSNGTNSVWVSPRTTLSNSVKVDGTTSQWPVGTKCTTTGCH